MVLLWSVLGSSSVIIPLSVQAGIFGASSTIENGASPASAPAESLVDMKLLSASRASNPLSARGGGDILVEEDALLRSGATGEDVYAASADQVGEISLYEVRPGDTLSQIAEMFEVTANTILWANDLKSATAIQPGDTLIILPIVGVQHVVKQGDTIAAIAKKYEGDADEIRSYNRISDEELTVGMTLVVPGGNMHIAAPARSSGSSAVAASAGSFINPAPGTIKTQGIHGYNAVDFGGAIGTAVRAAAAGEVIVAKSGGWNGGYGNYVVIKHGASGSQTLYAHLNSVSVGVGARVAAGDTIGALGNTGRSTGPHLHFEVRGGRNPF